MSDIIANYNTSTIAEMPNGIILGNYKKDPMVADPGYQSEADLERKLIENLVLPSFFHDRH